MLGIKVDEKAIIKNRYNRSSHLLQDTKRERNKHTNDSIKYKIAQAESQEDSSLPADGH